MSTTVTNYISPDLAYYFTDLARLPHVSDEERQRLTRSLSPTTRLDQQTRNRIVESHLSLVTHIARKRCPSDCYHFLPDIVSEAAFMLLTITERHAFQEGYDFTSYVVACTDTAMKRALNNRRQLIKIPQSTLWAAKQKGTLDQLLALQPESLDKYMHWYDTDMIEEPPASPVLSPQEVPPRDPSQHAQVQEWLSYLSPRAQQVLSLRYGLSDDDERSLSIADIAQELNLKPQTVRYIERDAIKRIRAIVNGTGTVIEKDGHKSVTGIYQGVYKKTNYEQKLTPELVTLLMQAAIGLCEQGIKVSAPQLAKETGKSVHLVRAFLRLYRDQIPLVISPKQTRTREARLAALTQVYAELIAQGTPFSIKQLARAAHVRNDLAAEFMHIQKGVQHAA
jgi:RNA polymerase sigma factor (sigma-70 family)